MTKCTYVLTAISSTDANRLRAIDGPRYVADGCPGYPCRQCLQDAEIGDELVLVTHDPFRIDSPYRSASPIFLHAVDCGEPPSARDDLPVQLTSRQLSVRAFDQAAMMTDAALIEGSILQATLERLFADKSVDHVDIHNAVRGCWAVRAERADR